MSTVGKPDGMTLLPFTTTPSMSTWVKHSASSRILTGRIEIRRVRAVQKGFCVSGDLLELVKGLQGTIHSGPGAADLSPSRMIRNKTRRGLTFSIAC